MNDITVPHNAIRTLHFSSDTPWVVLSSQTNQVPPNQLNEQARDGLDGFTSVVQYLVNCIDLPCCAYPC